MKKNRAIRRFISLVILLVAAALLLWGWWPLLNQEQVLSISPEQSLASTQVAEETTPQAVPTGLPSPTSAPGIPEQRLVILEWPGQLRTGDSEIVRLSLDVEDQQRNIPGAIGADEKDISELVEIPDGYDTHSIFAEARLDIAGLSVVPGDLVSQSLRPGENLTFTWSVHGTQAGKMRGTVWLYLRFLPLDGGQESRTALSAQTIEIEVVNLFGIGGTPARIMGLAGAAFGGLLGADDILNGIRWLFRRWRGR